MTRLTFLLLGLALALTLSLTKVNGSAFTTLNSNFDKFVNISLEYYRDYEAEDPVRLSKIPIEISNRLFTLEGYLENSLYYNLSTFIPDTYSDVPAGYLRFDGYTYGHSFQGSYNFNGSIASTIPFQYEGQYSISAEYDTSQSFMDGTSNFDEINGYVVMSSYWVGFGFYDSNVTFEGFLNGLDITEELKEQITSETISVVRAELGSAIFKYLDETLMAYVQRQFDQVPFLDILMGAEPIPPGESTSRETTISSVAPTTDSSCVHKEISRNELVSALKEALEESGKEKDELIEIKSSEKVENGVKVEMIYKRELFVPNK